MNCKWLQKNVCEYLDESLSPPDQAGAQRHLLECADCRAAVRREQRFSDALSGRFEQSVANLCLDDDFERRVIAALKATRAEEPSPAGFWSRFAWPLATAASLAAIIIFAAVFHWPQQALPNKTTPIVGDTRPDAVFVNVSYSLPAYIFERAGDFVVDALTFNAQTADESLIAKN